MDTRRSLIWQDEPSTVIDRTTAFKPRGVDYRLRQPRRGDTVKPAFDGGVKPPCDPCLWNARFVQWYGIEEPGRRQAV